VQGRKPYVWKVRLQNEDGTEENVEVRAHWDPDWKPGAGTLEEEVGLVGAIKKIRKTGVKWQPLQVELLGPA
jgi:hypothetical protein